jgi:phosphoglycolate/pyridoxal phosphate phosphatase family enzyme
MRYDVIRRPTRIYDAYVFDLDGTVILGDKLLPTAGETIQWLRSTGRRTVFLTNNPTNSRGQYAAKLTRLGLPTQAADIINSSYVMVDFLRQRMPGARLFVAGETSLCQELLAAGFVLTEEAGQVEAVIASFDRGFNYQKLQIGFDALRAGARFFATNDDPYCPVPGGGQPDAAAIIAAFAACSGRTVEAVTGKPSIHMATAVLNLLELPARDCLMIGDRLETDILLGFRAGMDTALTLTGATDLAIAAGSAIQPTFLISQLADLLPGG